MKIHGKKLNGPNVEVKVFPRSEGDIVIKAQAVLDESEFYELCPPPSPPIITKPDGTKRLDIEDEKYNNELRKWSSRKSGWITIKSLEATEGLEWESIDIGDPETWENVTQELKEAGFSTAERNVIHDIISVANGLDQKKIEEATARFLAGQEDKLRGESSPSSGQKSTQSGGPVNA